MRCRFALLIVLGLVWLASGAVSQSAAKPSPEKDAALDQTHPEARRRGPL